MLKSKNLISVLLGIGQVFVLASCMEVQTMDSIIEETKMIETTVNTTTTTTTTTAKSETTITTCEETTSTEETTTTPTLSTDGLTYLGLFAGKYYHGDYNPCAGGSGRTLLDCTPKVDSIKGSVASKYVYDRWGYDHNGRSMLYLEVYENPEMNGWYFVDDCDEDEDVIDFYFINYSDCPWETDGVIAVNVYFKEEQLS